MLTLTYNNRSNGKLACKGSSYPEKVLAYECSQLHLLEVDNRVVVPAKTHLREIVTSADVYHSWTVPSSDIKCDAVPGRLNQIYRYSLLAFQYLFPSFIFMIDSPAYAMEPPSPSDSIIAHASSETDSDKELFFTPPPSVSSTSSSSTSTPDINSAPNKGENEERYSFTYIKPGSEAHEAMKESVILRIVRNKFEEWESDGKMNGLHIKKTNEELAQALNLELVQTEEEMERLSKELLELDWAKFEKAPSGASYAGLSNLIKGQIRRFDSRYMRCGEKD